VRVLVTGAGGLLGGRLTALLRERGFEVIGVHRATPPPAGLRSVRCDLLDADALPRLLDAEHPDAVVHAAALARSTSCYEHPVLAESTNPHLPARLALLSHARGLRLVALSTDLVFSGTRAPVLEGDPPGPRSVYGRTKLAGEEAVLAAHPEAAVARVSLVLGHGHGPRGSASEAIAWSLQAGRPTLLFEDEYRTPIDPESVADAVVRLLRRGGAGRFHLAGPERLSRYELGRRVARLFGLSEAFIVRGRQADQPGTEPRPADVSLDSAHARRVLGWEPRPLDVALGESRRSPPT
jgi:dTDP-4-dehydrorhamnose reductase